MMISAFARASGLSVDTVRFYVRQGLLHPVTGLKGGTRPYQFFTPTELDTARVIRLGQLLGLTLKQIKAFVDELPAAERATPAILRFLHGQRDRLERQASDLHRLVAFLDAKIAWINDPANNTPPDFPSVGRRKR